MPTRDNDRITVGLVQINNSFSGACYVPYSVGLLQAYAQRHAPRPDRYHFTLPVYTRVAVDEACRQLAGADVVGFSAYVWNIRLSLAIAETLKRRHPETLIVFGGPQVPNASEAFLRAHPFIDLACHGEGEQSYLQVLESYPQRNWEHLAAASYLRPDGSYVPLREKPHLKDLRQVPSPYLEGTFEPLIAAHPEVSWLGLWETNRGCPFSCTFCDWGSATMAKLYSFDAERLYREVDWFAEHRTEFIFCCDANFGILPRDLELAQYVVQSKRARGYPHALSVQNTKNATERAYKVQKVLADSGLNKGVTVSLQSLDPHTLTSVRRQNISLQSFLELQRRFTRDRVITYTDIILGLPGETYDTFVEGVSQVIAHGQHNRIQFNNLTVLPNAEVGDPAYRERFGLVTVESRIINLHGCLADEDEVPESQQLVIATAAMPREEWVRTRAFGYMASLLHFDKLLQIPFVLLHETCLVSYCELIEAFACGDVAEFPVLAEVQQFFVDKARELQAGGFEYCQSAEWLNIWWPVDEYLLIKLCRENKFADFYQQAERLLARLVQQRRGELPPGLLRDAIALNRALVKLPLVSDDITVETAYNVWEYYNAVLLGESVPLAPRRSAYRIDRTSQRYPTWEQWYREVIWFDNKKGAYLYDGVQPLAEACAQP